MPGYRCLRGPRRNVSGPTSRTGCANTARPARLKSAKRYLLKLQPIANPEVMLGLTAMCIVRGLTGFMTFMLAFGLRRMHGVGLYWYGLVLAGTGVGAIVGLVLVGRLRKRLTEQQLLLSALWLIAATAIGCAVWGTLFAQVVLAFVVGLSGAVAQPSFDAMTQRYIPLSPQGRAFARFGMRQQLVWVVGSLTPVIVAFTLPQGDATMGVLGRAGGNSLCLRTSRPCVLCGMVRGIRDLGNTRDAAIWGSRREVRASGAGPGRGRRSPSCPLCALPFVDVRQSLFVGPITARQRTRGQIAGAPEPLKLVLTLRPTRSMDRSTRWSRPSTGRIVAVNLRGPSSLDLNGP